MVEPAPAPLGGEIAVPGDKSIGHRALLFAALADGEVQISGLSGGADNSRTARAIAALGAKVRREGDVVIVCGHGLDNLREPSATIDCGNSGTSMRLLAGLLSGQRFPSVLCGDESLSQRPMARITRPLKAMGAEISGRPGRHPGEVLPPLEIAGRRLAGCAHTLEVASAQVKSAILLAGLYAEGDTVVVEPGPSRDHTERMLSAMGAPITWRGHRVAVAPGGWDRTLSPAPVVVPGDPSSAAFAVVAALVRGALRVTVRGVCTNPTRTGFIDVLEQMGGAVLRERENERGEPTADLVIEGKADLCGTDVAGDTVVRAIDEIPVLAVAMALASGQSRVRDAGELRVKESDRIDATVAMLRAFGVTCEATADGFSVDGTAGKPFRACRIDARGDHRIAMAGAVAALCADGPVRIDDVANVATSYPRFAADMATLGATITPA
ncbi:MAG TPA: 3-phosphoshikimate 1-carboxyvinyltransferase [Kofleriaceae bacterium]|nr:3-phosphoshikimate 1-carboxyvinyltransferase [Kofleriaceae bacterium]